MASVGAQLSGEQFRPKTSRKALQPKNFSASQVNIIAGSWQKLSHDRSSNAIFTVGDSDKENQLISREIQPIKIRNPAEIDASLAEELAAIRQKLDRIRSEKEKTERILQERSFLLEKKLEEFEIRGKAQEKLEIELKKLQRLKELKNCISSATVKSLRDKEHEKKTQTKFQGSSIAEDNMEDKSTDTTVDADNELCEN